MTGSNKRTGPTRSAAADPRSFADHMDGHEERDTLVPVNKGKTRAPRREEQGSNPQPQNTGVTKAETLIFPNSDDPFVARKNSVRRNEMKELLAGRIRPEEHVDLHGLTRPKARKHLAEAIASARAEGQRCLLIIVGRGRHSRDGEGVLRAEIPGWLSHPDLADQIAAFGPALPRDGGRGALYVLMEA